MVNSCFLLLISQFFTTHWKRPWCWERLKAGEGDDRGWDGWMASPTQWTWVWVDSGSWWWTGKPGVLRFMGSQKVGHDWVTELYWFSFLYVCFPDFILVYFTFLIMSCLIEAANLKNIKSNEINVYLICPWDRFSRDFSLLLVFTRAGAESH